MRLDSFLRLRKWNLYNEALIVRVNTESSYTINLYENDAKEDRKIKKINYENSLSLSIKNT